MGLKNNTVSLEDNYEEWHNIFLNEKEKLKKLFANLAIDIEHIGSTSIKGLPAKPIVDIAVSVNNFQSIKNIYGKLSKHYSIKENFDYDEILLIKEDKEMTYCLIHVMPLNSERYKNTILFRDCLLNNKEILKKYQTLKEQLATTYGNDRKMYTKSKNDFIQKVLQDLK